MNQLPKWKDKLLLTPGPLTTSQKIKHAMLKDVGSRDYEFMRIVREIRENLLDIALAPKHDYTTVIMQGSGTFGIESVISSAIPPTGKLLVLINGIYGERISKIAKTLNIDVVELTNEQNQEPSLDELKKVLKKDKSITSVAVVHCETTTGIFNPIEKIARVVKANNKILIVDAMSSFGAVEINVGKLEIDYLISSSNKCIEGVPGFSFIIANKQELEKTELYARSVSFNLYEQWKILEQTGQFRFTPPTHALLAFRQAITELIEEGGVKARSSRYKDNYNTLIAGMTKLGFSCFLPDNKRGWIITSFVMPNNKNFSFERFYGILNDLGYVIYPGKLTKADSFRIGNIGRIYKSDIEDLLSAIERTLVLMGVKL